MTKKPAMELDQFSLAESGSGVNPVPSVVSGMSKTSSVSRNRMDLTEDPIVEARNKLRNIIRMRNPSRVSPSESMMTSDESRYSWNVPSMS